MQSKVGEIYDGKVTGLTTFGAFVKMSNGETGMVHISEVATNYVKDIKEHLTEGQDVKVKVLTINESNKISLSIKQTIEQPKTENEFKGKKPPQKNSYPPRDSAKRPAAQTKSVNQAPAPLSFEDMMAKFKQESDEKMSALKRSTEFKGNNRRSGR